LFFLRSTQGAFGRWAVPPPEAGYVIWQDHFNSRLGTRGTIVFTGLAQLTKVRQNDDMGSKGRLQPTSKKISTLRCTPGVFFIGSPWLPMLSFAG
jgi:hypothetical protein